MKKRTIFKTSASALLFSTILLGAATVSADDKGNQSTSTDANDLTTANQTKTNDTTAANNASQSDTTSQQSASDQTAQQSATVDNSQSDQDTNTNASQTTDSNDSNNSKITVIYANSWASENGNWYYHGKDGKNVTGFQTINGKKYYFDQSGKQIKGKTVTIDGSTYDFDANSGEMYQNRWGVTPHSWGDYYSYFGADGKAVEGQQTIDGHSYFFASSYSVNDSSLKTSDKGIYRVADATVSDDSGNSYYYNANGYLETGLFYDGYYWEYANDKGVIQTGEVDYNGQHLYFDSAGNQVKGAAYDAAGNLHYTDPNSGEIYKNRWAEFSLYGSKTNYAYIGSDGIALTGMQTIDGVTYYFDKDGKEVKGDFIIDKDGYAHYTNAATGKVYEPTAYANRYIQDQEGNWYYVGSDGKVLTGTQVINGETVFFDQDGKQVKNDFAINQDGKTYFYNGTDGQRTYSQFVTKDYDYSYPTWYYVGSDGQKVTGSQMIDGLHLFFNEDGSQVKEDIATDENGVTHYYSGTNGDIVKNDWVKLGVTYWGHTDQDGVLMTGQQTIDGKTYYFDDQGHELLHSIHTDADGQMYYYGSDGAMVTNTTIVTENPSDENHVAAYTADAKGHLTQLFNQTVTDQDGDQYRVTEEGYAYIVR